MKNKVLAMLVVALVVGPALAPDTAMASSISPSAFSATLNVGDTVDVNATVTVQEGLGFYTLVMIDSTEVPTGITFSTLPASYVGSWEPSVPTNFDFTLRYLAVLPGIYSFNLYASIADGGVCCQRVATMSNRIVVNGVTSVPEPGTLALLGFGLAGLGFARRRKQM